MQVQTLNRLTATRDNLVDTVAHVRRTVPETEQDAIITPCEDAIYALCKAIASA